VLGVEPKQSVAPVGTDVHDVVNFLDALEEHEDVQRVYSNAELDLAQLEALA
jgi:transcriptional/translational regulatory protein YebC/TACO1